jgi:hypothetical protein
MVARAAIRVLQARIAEREVHASRKLQFDGFIVGLAVKYGFDGCREDSRWRFKDSVLQTKNFYNRNKKSGRVVDSSEIWRCPGTAFFRDGGPVPKSADLIWVTVASAIGPLSLSEK